MQAFLLSVGEDDQQNDHNQDGGDDSVQLKLLLQHLALQLLGIRAEQLKDENQICQSLTSAVSARASVLSTMMSSFSPRSIILSTSQPPQLLPTDVINHNTLHGIELLLHTGGSISVGVVPLGL